MVIKTLSNQMNTFKKIIPYANKQKGRTAMTQLFEDNFKVCFNLQNTETEKIIEEFEDNYTYKTNRKNGLKFYHEMMSFSELDNVNLTQDKVEDLIYKYLDLRCPKSLAYASVHTDKSHLHVHIVVSSNLVKSKKATRLTKKEFIEVRNQIERYQYEKYPELSHSIVYINKEVDKKKINVSDKEYRIKKRGKISQKEQMIELFENAIGQSKTSKHFFDVATRNGEVSFYTYREKVNGFLFNGRKYRFSTLIKNIDSKEIQKEYTRKLNGYESLYKMVEKQQQKEKQIER